MITIIYDPEYGSFPVDTYSINNWYNHFSIWIVPNTWTDEDWL